MRSTLLLAASFFAVACAHKPAAHDGVHHSFDNAEEWAKAFEDPSRDEWQKPNEVIAALKLEPTMKLADIGSATGYFSVRFAKAFPKGKVFGVDVESAMVKYLNDRAEKEGLDNLTSILGAYDDAKIPTPVDLILIVDTYHHIDERPAYFTKLAASLAPKGQLAIIDFTKSSKKGPPESAKIAPDVVEAELTQAGFTKRASFDFLPDQYFLVFEKR